MNHHLYREIQGHYFLSTSACICITVYVYLVVHLYECIIMCVPVQHVTIIIESVDYK